MSTRYSFRIDRETDRLVRQLAASRGVTRSEIVREALRRLVQDEGRAPDTTASELTRDLIGSYRSGRGDLSVSTGEGLRKHLRARREEPG